MMYTNRLVKGFGLAAMALGALLAVGCDSMHWGDENKSGSMPATMPSTAPTSRGPVSAGAQPTPAARPVTTATPPTQANAKVAIRVKAGATAPFTDKAGHVWAADMGFDGGETIDRDASMVVSGTNDPEMFRSERYSMNGYTFTVPNGNYKVNLYFAETYDGIAGPGDRVFSFSVNGKEHKDFDIYKEAGGAQKVKVVTENVTVTDGKVDIKFTPGAQNPCINAIEIIPA